MDPLSPLIEAFVNGLGPPPRPRAVRNHECGACGRMVNRLWPHACKLPEFQPLPDPPRDLECTCGFYVSIGPEGERYLYPSGATHRTHLKPKTEPDFYAMAYAREPSNDQGEVAERLRDEWVAEEELRYHRWYETEEGRAGARPLDRPPLVTLQRPKRITAHSVEAELDDQGPQAAAPPRHAPKRRPGRTL